MCSFKAGGSLSLLFIPRNCPQSLLICRRSVGEIPHTVWDGCVQFGSWWSVPHWSRVNETGWVSSCCCTHQAFKISLFFPFWCCIQSGDVTQQLFLSFFTSFMFTGPYGWRTPFPWVHVVQLFCGGVDPHKLQIWSRKRKFSWFPGPLKFSFYWWQVWTSSFFGSVLLGSLANGRSLGSCLALDVVWLCNGEEVRYKKFGKTQDKFIAEQNHKFSLPKVLSHFGVGLLTHIYCPFFVLKCENVLCLNQNGQWILSQV